MKSDCLFIDRIEVPCRIGTSAEERAFPQLVWLSIRAELPLSEAGRTDDLGKSVDYAAIVAQTRSILQDRVFNLVEAAAEAVAAAVLEHREIRAVWIRVEKQVLQAVERVGVEIWRERGDQ